MSSLHHSAPRVLSKDIIYCGQSVTVSCDAKCHKAWGMSQRPRVQLSDDEDDFTYLPDVEAGIAPDDPGTYEGGDGKSPRSLNKWCVRECERSVMRQTGEPLDLPDFSTSNTEV